METLIQIISGLEKIATAHRQINSFGFGDISDFNTSGITQMPAMFVELNNITRIRRETAFKFDIFIMSLVLNGKQDENNVLSDMILIAHDVIYEMTHPDWSWIFLEEKENIVFEDFIEKTSDFLTGVKFTVTIMLDIVRDRCAIPEKSILRI